MDVAFRKEAVLQRLQRQFELKLVTKFRSSRVNSICRGCNEGRSKRVVPLKRGYKSCNGIVFFFFFFFLFFCPTQRVEPQETNERTNERRKEEEKKGDSKETLLCFLDGNVFDVRLIVSFRVYKYLFASRDKNERARMFERVDSNV